MISSYMHTFQVFRFLICTVWKFGNFPAKQILREINFGELVGLKSAILIQGDPNQNLKFVLAITLKLCISDPMLVKPKCVG